LRIVFLLVFTAFIARPPCSPISSCSLSLAGKKITGAVLKSAAGPQAAELKELILAQSSYHGIKGGRCAGGGGGESGAEILEKILIPEGCGRDEKVRAALASLIKAAPKLEKLAIPGDFGIGLVRASTTEVLIYKPFNHPYHFLEAVVRAVFEADLLA
jgi:hypothetical protein